MLYPPHSKGFLGKGRFSNVPQISAHWDNDLHEEKCIPSSISPGNIFDELKNQFD